MGQLEGQLAGSIPALDPALVADLVAEAEAYERLTAYYHRLGNGRLMVESAIKARARRRLLEDTCGTAGEHQTLTRTA